MKAIHRRVRICNEPNKPLSLRVEDADTGKEIKGVLAVRYEADILRSRAEIEVVAEIDVVTDAELTGYRIDKSGKYVELEDWTDL